MERAAEENPSDLPINPGAGDDEIDEASGNMARSSISKEDVRTAEGTITGDALTEKVQSRPVASDGHP